MEFFYHYVPLVTVAGLGIDLSGEPDFAFKTDNIEICTSDVCAPAAQRVKEMLSRQSTMPNDPQAPAEGQSVLHFLFSNTVQILNDDNVTKPENDLISPNWIKKYLFCIPARVVAWYTLENNAASVAQQINAAKVKLASHDISLIAVVVGSVDELNQHVASLRRDTALPSRTGLLTLTDTASDREIAVFTESLVQLLAAGVGDFYALQARATRQRRFSAENKSDDLTRDLKYNFELAVFSELKLDYRGALKLYENSFDCARAYLESISISSSFWTNARLMVDIISAKIYRHTLHFMEFAQAYKKFKVILRGIAHIITSNNIDPQSRAMLLWQASQLMRLAQTLQSVRFVVQEPNWAVSPPSKMGEPPANCLPCAGFLYLQAANLYAAEPIEHEESDHDPYGSQLKNCAKEAFAAAVTEFAGNRNCRAKALMSYGDWLVAHDDRKGAAETYRAALLTLRPPWPSLRILLEQKLLKIAPTERDRVSAQFGLFAVGEGPAPKSDVDIGTIQLPLFEAYGTFLDTTTYLGRKVDCQIQLVPLFKETLFLNALSIEFSCGQITLVADDSLNPSQQTVALVEISDWGLNVPVNLGFNSVKVFQLTFRAAHRGQVDMKHIILHGKDVKFAQRLNIDAGTKWFKDPVASNTTRHLRLGHPKSLWIDTRPALLTLESLYPENPAVDEHFDFVLEITNKETEASFVEVKIESQLAEPGNAAPTSPWPSPLPSPGGLGLVTAKNLIIDPGAKKQVSGEVIVGDRMIIITINVQYYTRSDSTPLSISKEILLEPTKPFRVNFDLLAVIHPGVWPSLFVPNNSEDTMPRIPRRWNLRASILSLFDTTLILHRTFLTLHSEQAVTNTIDGKPVRRLTGYGSQQQEIEHNGSIKHNYLFDCERRSEALRKYEVHGEILIEWSRPGGSKNIMHVPRLKLSLPSQEPRVLVWLSKDQPIVVNYTIENATSHVLTFAVSMASSLAFAFQGPKAFDLRLLPYTRRVVEYRMVPLGLSHSSQSRVLPEIRVYDTHYKRTLTVIPGDESISFEHGYLALAEISPEVFQEARTCKV